MYCVTLESVTLESPDLTDSEGCCKAPPAFALPGDPK